MSTRIYYDFGPILSYNAIYNLACGGRGIGKTYGAKKLVVKKAITNGEQFIYLRRYKTEVAATRDAFFADFAHEFPEKEFRVFGNKAQMTDYFDEEKFSDEAELKKAKKERVWETIGFFVALSTSLIQKGRPFPQVRTIIYDEFIIEKGALQYLPNEVKVFNDFYSTVDRYRKKNEVKVLFLANSVSIMNPYFIAWDIVPDEESEIVKRGSGFVVAHFPDSEEFSKDIYQTRFGKFIEGTEYADYAVGNQFSDNNDSLIQGKGYKARYQFTLECVNGTFSIWYDMINNKYHIQDRLPKVQEVYTLVPEKMDEGKTLMTVRDKPIAYLRASFNNARVVFDKPSTRNTFREIFKR